ncbi:uncharacterized protein PAC_12194 [Phialocephala subalpina]|uniref:Uncharacterized protein n=1 Tax=Phialocephala subalpina TaxID=576137 RepID=A0A1L7XBF1_9HELO|nr:uncharacterized protein PAC_12194 [Phialocephala subalpina]
MSSGPTLLNHYCCPIPRPPNFIAAEELVIGASVRPLAYPARDMSQERGHLERDFSERTPEHVPFRAVCRRIKYRVISANDLVHIDVYSQSRTPGRTPGQKKHPQPPFEAGFEYARDVPFLHVIGDLAAVEAISFPAFELQNRNAAQSTSWQADSSEEQASHGSLIPRKPVPKSSSRTSDCSENETAVASRDPAPRPLSQTTSSACLKGLLLISLTVPFFVYGGTTWHLHNTPVKDEEQWLVLKYFGNKLSTTFPFAFAIVVGSAIKQISSWKLERGATLGFLEQMIGSQSVGATVTTQLLLRRLNTLTLILICIWSLSPLSSQSCLQILSVQDHSIMSNARVQHFDTQGNPAFSDGVGAYSTILPSLNTILGASLIAPASVRTSTMDLWGNVKIPDISRLTQNTSADPQGWFNLTLNASTIEYSSMLGIPVDGLLEKDNTTFTMWTSYISVSCDNSSDSGIFIESWTFDKNGSTGAWNGSFPVTNIDFAQSTAFKNRTIYAIGAVPGELLTTLDVKDPDSHTILSTFILGIDQFYEGFYGQVDEFDNDTRPYAPARIFFRSVYGGIAALCPITTSYVESTVECVGTACSATAIRLSRLKHANSNLTGLGFSQAFEDFTQSLLFSTYIPEMTVGIGANSMLEQFIVDPDSTSYGGLGVGGVGSSMQALEPDTIAIRLQQILDTYWYGSYWPAGYTNSSSFASDSPPISAQATNVVWEAIYVCNFAWLSVLFLGTIIMFVSALIGLYFSLLIRGPDVLGYISTFLRDSPYVSTSGQESTMDGLERSRKYGNMKLRLVDVEDENENTRYIAIAEDGAGVRHSLVKQRLYR